MIFFPTVEFKNKYKVFSSMTSPFNLSRNKFIPKDTCISSFGIKYVLPGEPILLIRTSPPYTLLFDKNSYEDLEIYFTLSEKLLVSKSVVLTI